ncbi:MAG: glutathione S-transferase [Proteobacteria bacterium]|nr:glutathione S-transferase [Pseudomonadota bacterium]
MSARPVLYSFRRCPYAIRARLALGVSGQRCELREVVLRDKPPELLSASPKGTVPVLVLPDGQVIDQSLDIMRWALVRHDPECWLDGDDDASRTLIATCDGPFKQALDAYKYPERHPAQPRGAAQAGAATILDELEARLRVHAFLCADGPRLADAAWAPFVRQFAQVDAVWFAGRPWPRLQAWLAGWLQGPLWPRVMHKYARWQAPERGVDFPPAA